MTGQFRWGILGAANICEAFIRGVKAGTASRVEAIASRSIEKARAFAEANAIPHAFGSYEELIKSGLVDAVYVPLPNSLHAEWTIRSLEAGLPVLCEKPFTVDAARAREVAVVAKRTGLAVAEAFMYRFHPMYARVLELVRAGAIGPIVSMNGRFTFMLENRAEVAASAELAGGSLMDVGCYCVNLFRMVTGREPIRASAFERRTTVEDTIVGLLEFPGGVLAQFESSIENHERHGAEVAGTTGSISIPRPWHPGEASATFILRQGEKETIVETPGADPYRLEVEDFVLACTGGQPRWPVEDAVANMTVIDALYRSAREGRVVEIK
jgi:D-xylose 1-dehydrogenase (NADP+, D-xylono-1,5-lactone-forming)